MYRYVYKIIENVVAHFLTTGMNLITHKNHLCSAIYVSYVDVLFKYSLQYVYYACNYLEINK